jgi:D-threo-aldose 1-dehydrogenase
MEMRRLGRTGLEAPVIGLGGAPLAHAESSDADALETVWSTLEAGITFIDTAPFYGAERSERLIGRALAERPELTQGLVLSTKTGRYADHRDYSYDRTLRSIEGSLERLGRTYFSMVHIHDPDSSEELEQILRYRAAHAALLRLKEEGVIGAIGIGTRALDALQLAIDCGGFDVLMIANQYNLLEQAGKAIIESAARHDVGVIIAGVYATGILAKGPVPQARYGYRPAGDEIVERTRRIQDVCQRWGVSLPAVAIAFCLRGPASHVVTVLGARGRGQVEHNLTWATEPAPEGLWAEIDEVVWGRRLPPMRPL